MTICQTCLDTGTGPTVTHGPFARGVAGMDFVLIKPPCPACIRGPRDTPASPEAVALARRTPWTAHFAERVIEAHREIAPTIDLDAFANTVMVVGLAALRGAFTPRAPSDPGARFPEDYDAGAIARALERRGLSPPE